MKFLVDAKIMYFGATNYSTMTPKPKTFKFLVIIFSFSFLVFSFMGCTTIPVKETLATYNLNGTTYLSLVSLCDSRGIDWQYDTFTRAIALSKESHRINLMVGEALALVDRREVYLKAPVDIYEGMIVVPHKFKEEIVEELFKEKYPPAKAILPIARIRKIVIDAGHGGNDPGAIGRSGLREKDVNLDIAKRLSRLLESSGVNVVLTRNSDRFISLDRRGAIANNSKADLFVSIHSNANRVRSLSGVEVYYVSPSVSDSKRALSSAKTAALNLDSSFFASHSLDLKAILWDMIYTNARGESIELSRYLCRWMRSNLEAKILGIKAARFQVLRDVRMPAVLIEVGFLSNINEERKLKNSYYRQKIAEGIADGIRDYAKKSSLMELVSR